MYLMYLHETTLSVYPAYMNYRNYVIRALHVTLHVSLLNVVPPIDYRASSTSLS